MILLKIVVYILTGLNVVIWYEIWKFYLPSVYTDYDQRCADVLT